MTFEISVGGSVVGVGSVKGTSSNPSMISK